MALSYDLISIARGVRTLTIDIRGGLRPKELQAILEDYTPEWIAAQHPAERGRLREEKNELEADLAEALSVDTIRRRAINYVIALTSTGTRREMRL